MSDGENNQLAIMRREIAARLRHVCEQWPEAEFEKLVNEIADITRRYDLGGGTQFIHDPRLTDSLVERLKGPRKSGEH